MKSKDELKLIISTMEYKEQVMEYRKVFLENNENLSGCAELEDVSTYEEWIDFDDRKAKIYSDEYVPATVCLCIREKDNKLVGIIDFRHYLSDFLLNYGGNIGSAKIIMANGGVLENEINDNNKLSLSGTLQRYWIEL